jgi:hypothetical protein
MKHALLMGFVAMTLLAALLVIVRFQVAVAQSRVKGAHDRAGALGLLDEG